MIITKIELDNRRFDDNVAKTVEVVSNKPVDALTMSKLTDILLHTVCPNEAMFGAIPNFKSFNGVDRIEMHYD